MTLDKCVVDGCGNPPWGKGMAPLYRNETIVGYVSVWHALCIEHNKCEGADKDKALEALCAKMIDWHSKGLDIFTGESQ